MKHTITTTDENGRLIDVRVTEVANNGGYAELRGVAPGGIRELKRLTESGGRGTERHEPTDEAALDKALLENFRQMGLSEAGARVAAAGRLGKHPSVPIGSVSESQASENRMAVLSEAERDELGRLDAAVEAKFQRLLRSAGGRR